MIGEVDFILNWHRWIMTWQLLLLKLSKRCFAMGKVISFYLAELSQLCFKTAK